jgi:hypothetical protein
VQSSTQTVRWQRAIQQIHTPHNQQTEEFPPAWESEYWVLVGPLIVTPHWRAKELNVTKTCAIQPKVKRCYKAEVESALVRKSRECFKSSIISWSLSIHRICHNFSYCVIESVVTFLVIEWIALRKTVSYWNPRKVIDGDMILHVGHWYCDILFNIEGYYRSLNWRFDPFATSFWILRLCIMASVNRSSRLNIAQFIQISNYLRWFFLNIC